MGRFIGRKKERDVATFIISACVIWNQCSVLCDRDSRVRNVFPITAPGMGRFQLFIRVFGLWVRVKVLSCGCNNRFPITNRNSVVCYHNTQNKP